MKDRAAKFVRFLKTTAIGGLIFLLPLAVIGGLLGYVYQIVHVVFVALKESALSEYLPLDNAVSLGILFSLAVAILLALCFFCGLAARRAIGRKFSQQIERRLVMVFPKYAIYKDIVAGNLGGDDLAPSLKPVTVQLIDMVRVGYEAGRTNQGLVIVYLPGSPDPWIGSVAIVEPRRVQPLNVDFNETAAICERLGRDSTQLLASVRPIDVSSCDSKSKEGV